LIMQRAPNGATRDLGDPDPERDARAAVSLWALAGAAAAGESRREQREPVLRLGALELLVASLDDHAPPTAVRVLVHLEADGRVRAHHRHLLPDERVRI